MIGNLQKYTHIPDRPSLTFSPCFFGLLPHTQNCGIDAFAKGLGSKVGEGIYLGTALDQVKDGKVRTPLGRLLSSCINRLTFLLFCSSRLKRRGVTCDRSLNLPS